MNELVCLQCFKTFSSRHGHFCLNDYWIPVMPGRNIPFQLIENDEVIWTKEFVIEAFERYLREVSENSDILNGNPEFSAEAGIYDELNHDNNRLLNSNQDSAMRNMPDERDTSELSNDMSIENKEKNQKEHESKIDNDTDYEMTSDEIRQAEKNPQLLKYGRNASNNLIKNRIRDPQDDFAIKEAERAPSFIPSKISTVTNKADSATITVFKKNQTKPSSNNIEKTQDKCTTSSASYEINLKNTDLLRNTGELPEEDSSNTEKSKVANECSIVYEHAVAGPSRLDFNKENRPATSNIFQSKKNLQTYVRRHTSEKPFKCEVCEICFPSRITLRQHERTHIKLFSCKICQKIFSTEGNLRMHLHSHSAIKRFQCEICGIKFFYKKSLQNHTKETHTKNGKSEKPRLS